jgi:hypothetical protein
MLLPTYLPVCSLDIFKAPVALSSLLEMCTASDHLSGPDAWPQSCVLRVIRIALERAECATPYPHLTLSIIQQATSKGNGSCCMSEQYNGLVLVGRCPFQLREKSGECCGCSFVDRFYVLSFARRVENGRPAFGRYFRKERV